MPLSSFCQESDEERIKIGLVLSGGGAKGIAHVGIIRAMEEAGIRPDYVVGTSMGSVVGGLYALGYSADQLEEIIRSIDWDLIISNRVDFKDISFEEKEYYNRYLLEIPLENWKPSVPSGLIEGQVLSEVLHYYSWPSNTYDSFDEFPIPFRCIATDIKGGRPVIFKDGYLHDAIRSSIAIPTAFTAFEFDTTAVVDGGIVDNFPVDVVREMGADFVIGVNVSDEDFLDYEDLNGFAAILTQLAMAESLRLTKENIDQTDLYIKPDLGPYSTGSFGAYEAILKLGDETGQLYLADFQGVADSLNLPPIEKYSTPDNRSVRLSEIEIKGNSLFSDSFIKSKLDLDPGDTITPSMAKESIRHVFGINGFYKVDYSLNKAQNGDYKMVVRTKEKPSHTLSTSLHYDNIFSAGLLFNLTIRNWIGNSSRAVILTDISKNPKIRFDYYKYLGQEKKFLFNFRSDYIRQEFPSYENGRPSQLNIIRNSRVEAQLMTVNSLKESWSFGAVYDLERSRIRFNSSIPEDIRNSTDYYFGIRGRYYRNSQNDRNFPTKGAEGLLEANFRFESKLSLNLRSGVDTLFLNTDFGEEIGIPKDDLEELIKGFIPNPYFSVYGRYSRFFTISRNLQLLPQGAVGLVLSNEEATKFFREYLVGGYQTVRFGDTQLYGLNYGEISTPNFAKLGLVLQYLPVKKLYLRSGLNFLGYSEHVPLTDWGNIKGQSLWGYGVDASYQSILGPITLGVGSNSLDEKIRFHLSLGLSFNFTDR
ncbi:patatin-like phospholipase family protein [uncultured Algoriphagus sp.]|uniref:patatin-like phospholipase family protein n=1 Tax=uncultured Algoriphagus sp. TaxID=417365 RepID=UPI00258EF517|nr:patatin-like phospholipase family protein [uncultured Algoriphagus sp.]